MPLNGLSDALWQQRNLLELLLFKLEEEQLILTSGRSRWLAHATREVETVLDEIRTAELGRALAAELAAVTLGLPAESSLAQIAAAAPAPWDDLLRAHRDAFTSLATEIAQLSDGNRELLTLSHRATQETLATLQDVHTYTGTGATAATSHAAQLVDRTF
ncbi:flagellar export chaperone FlgN [Cellulomonas biazotea]|nr:flagellar export chaperone FlgN [Cellulomonas biazotea]